MARGKLSLNDFSKFYKVYLNDIAAAGTETAEIDLDNDLDLDREEGIVLLATHMVMGDDVPWTDPESQIEGWISEVSTEDPNIGMYPKMVIGGLATAATIEGNGAARSDRIYVQRGLLFPKNFFINARNLDTTTAHDTEIVFEYYVVSLRDFDMADVYGLIRGQAAETT